MLMLLAIWVLPVIGVTGAVAVMLRLPLMWGGLLWVTLVVAGVLLTAVHSLAGILSAIGMFGAVGWAVALYAGPYADRKQVTIWVLCVGILFGGALIVMSKLFGVGAI